jgi:hypothetical protein
MTIKDMRQKAKDSLASWLSAGLDRAIFDALCFDYIEQLLTRPLIQLEDDQGLPYCVELSVGDYIEWTDDYGNEYNSGHVYDTHGGESFVTARLRKRVRNNVQKGYPDGVKPKICTVAAHKIKVVKQR